MDLAALTVWIRPDSEEDADELALLTERLRVELLELDVDSVVPLSESTAPEHAKGLASIAGALVVQLGTLEGLRAFVNSVWHWASRTRRTVEVRIGDDLLRLTGVTSEQQEKIIDAWVTRQAAGT